MEAITVRVEDNNGELTVGRMVGANWSFCRVPDGVSHMQIAFVGWFNQMMEKNQPGVEFEIEYADGAQNRWM